MIVIYYTLLYYTILHYTILYYTILIFHVSFACIVLFVQPTSTSPIYPSSWERTKAALRASLGERRRWTNGEPYWNIYRIYIWIVLKHQNNWLLFFSNILAEQEQNKGQWTALSCLPRNKPHIQCEKPVDRVKGAVLFLMTRTSYPSSVLETCWNIYTVYTYII